MAEAYLRRLGGDALQVESAGLDPTTINPLVVSVMYGPRAGWNGPGHGRRGWGAGPHGPGYGMNGNWQRGQGMGFGPWNN